MTKTWKISYRFDDKTGSKNAWEGINRVYENGKLVNTVRWGSFKTEESAIKGLKKKVERCNSNEIFMHDGKTIEFVGKSDK